MTPWKLEQVTQKCARWLYSAYQDFSNNHPNSPERLWFAQGALTPLNPVADSPKIPIEDAREVFATLEKRYLIERKTIPIKDDKGRRGTAEVFFVNRRMTHEWEKLMSKSGFWNMKASPVIYYIVGEKWALLVLIFILSAIGASFFQDLGNDLYKDWLGSYFRR